MAVMIVRGVALLMGGEDEAGECARRGRLSERSPSQSLLLPARLRPPHVTGAADRKTAPLQPLPIQLRRYAPPHPHTDKRRSSGDHS